MSDADRQPGPADVRVAGLSIWVFGRQFEDLHDFWDGNWLEVLARCEAESACVQARGAIIHAPELYRWLEEARRCHESLNGTAELVCLEPHVNARLSLEQGRGELIVDITPDLLNQQHRFTFAIDQSYLPALISGLEGIAARFPIRDPR
ncbi:MAG: hypothetical protein AMXMBFR47_02950 [Planctomycetota bacterium]